jgi:hypothetical protein
MVLIASASVLQFALALFIKVFFFAWGFLDDFAKVRLFYLHCCILHPWHSLTEAHDSDFCWFWQVTWCALCTRLVLANIFWKGKADKFYSTTWHTYWP